MHCELVALHGFVPVVVARGAPAVQLDGKSDKDNKRRLA
jgi:hypothetical protein